MRLHIYPEVYDGEKWNFSYIAYDLYAKDLKRRIDECSDIVDSDGDGYDDPNEREHAIYEAQDIMEEAEQELDALNASRDAGKPIEFALPNMPVLNSVLTNDGMSNNIAVPTLVVRSSDPSEKRYALYAERPAYATLFQLGLSYILDFDWNDEVYLDVYLNASEFKKFKEHGEPGYWSNNVWNDEMKCVTNEEMTKALDTLPKSELNKLNKLYTAVRIKTKISRVCMPFISEVIPALSSLDEDPLNVRIIYWLD